MKNLKDYLIGKYGKEEFERMYSLSKHKLEERKKDFQKIINEKYPNRKGRLLGSQSKAMPDLIFKRVLEHFFKQDDELYLIYELEGYEGARIGDIVQLKVKDIDFSRHILKIYNHKESRWYEVPLYKQVEKDLRNFLIKHEVDIKKHENFLFFTCDDVHHPITKFKHLTQQYVNRRLVRFLEDSKLNQVYAIRSNGGNLHLYTTHSIRGHAGTKIRNETGKIELAAKLLDHSPRSLSTTELYMERSEDELEKSIRKD